MYGFGSGVLIGTRTDVANATPINFGLVQEVSFDFQFDLKELYGQYQMPVTIARGKGKITGKAKAARLSALAFNNLFFGMSAATGQVATAFNENGAIPGTPYQITVANAANFAADLGVVYAATGLPLTKVASSPAAGQYSVSAGGVYTFAAADTTLGVLVTYTYNISASGRKITITNQLLGTTPRFSMAFHETYEGLAFNLQLYRCVSSKLALPAKLDDFIIPEFDISVFADEAGTIGVASFAEAS